MFDTILNSYSNSPAGMIPAPGNDLGLNWTSANITGVPATMLETFRAALKEDGEVKP